MSEEYSYWYCHNCGEELPSSRVSYGEKCDTCGHPVEWITGSLPTPTFTVWPTVEEWEKKTGKKLSTGDVVWVHTKNKGRWGYFTLSRDGLWRPTVVAIPGLGRPPADWRPGMPYPKENKDNENI